MLRFRSVIGAATIIFPAHSTEWCRGKEKMSMMKGESVPRACSSMCLTLKIRRPKVSRLSERISRIEQLLAENLMSDQVSGIVSFQYAALGAARD